MWGDQVCCVCHRQSTLITSTTLTGQFRKSIAACVRGCSCQVSPSSTLAKDSRNSAATLVSSSWLATHDFQWANSGFPKTAAKISRPNCKGTTALPPLVLCKNRFLLRPLMISA
mmetsp:Transcript_30100/g.62927  ORF Transcript_30100/g.62927 Transcript_30100/m.62927 type:complete len:114 (+) Transcript_30100:375-716(+)